MAPEVIDEKEMEQYLLGLLPEERAFILEEKGLADYDFLEDLIAVENRLIDDYLMGELSPADRAQFESHVLSSPKRRERVEFARKFLKSIPQLPAVAAAPVPKTSDVAEQGWWAEWAQWVFVFNRRKSLGMAAVAATLLIAIAGLSFWEARRARRELAQIRDERVSLQLREQDLRARLNSQQEQNEELRKALERTRAELEELMAEEALSQRSPARSSLATIAALILRPPDFRGPTDRIPLLVINADTRLASFTLVLDKKLIGTILESYPNVRAELNGSGGDIEWKQEGLQPRTVKAGTAFIVTLPADHLNTGDYKLRLVGAGPSAETTIAEYPFKVEKK